MRYQLTSYKIKINNYKSTKYIKKCKYFINIYGIKEKNTKNTHKIQTKNTKKILNMNKKYIIFNIFKILFFIKKNI